MLLPFAVLAGIILLVVIIRNRQRSDGDASDSGIGYVGDSGSGGDYSSGLNSGHSDSSSSSDSWGDGDAAGGGDSGADGGDGGGDGGGGDGGSD